MQVVSRSELSSLYDRIDVALGLRLVEAVLAPELTDEVVLALERAEFLLGELAPFCADVLKQDLPAFDSIASTGRGGVRINGVHMRNPQNIN